MDEGLVTKNGNAEPKAGHRSVANLAVAGDGVIPIEFLILVSRANRFENNIVCQKYLGHFM
ncbi:hypothetical protein [Mesorhizobium sp. ArgA1]